MRHVKHIASHIKHCLTEYRILLDLDLERSGTTTKWSKCQPPKGDATPWQKLPWVLNVTNHRVLDHKEHFYFAKNFEAKQRQSQDTLTAEAMILPFSQSYPGQEITCALLSRSPASCRRQLDSPGVLSNHKRLCHERRQSFQNIELLNR